MNFAKALLDNINTVNSKPAIIDDNRTLCYNEFTAELTKTVNFLKDRGISNRDRVALFAVDSIEWLMTYLSCLYIGAVPVLISTRIPQASVDKMMLTANATKIFYDSQTADINKFTVVLDTLLDRQDLLVFTSSKELPEPSNHTASELGHLASSSGTSGFGHKFVQHSHQNFLITVNMCKELDEVTQDSIIFTPAKLTFHLGLFLALTALYSGATTIITNHQPTRSFLHNVVKTNKVTHVFVTPGVLGILAKRNTDIEDFSSVVFMGCGGEKLSATLETEFTKIYNIPVLNHLGSAEVIMWMTAQNSNIYKFGSIGKPPKGVKAEIRKEDGTVCAIGEIGELWVEHPSATLGYLDKPEENAETFIDGWIRFKDLVYQDNEGFFFYVSRSDNYVRINSSFVNLVEVESEIEKITGVDECVALVDSRNNGLSSLCVKIKLESDSHLDPGTIRKFLEPRVEINMIPRYIEFVDTIHRTVTTKKIRNQLLYNLNT